MACSPPGPGHDPADAQIRTTRTALLALLSGADPRELETAGELAVEDDTDALGRLLGVLDTPDPDFSIVTP